MNEQTSAELLDALGEALVILDSDGVAEYRSESFVKWPAELPARVRSAIARTSWGESMTYVEVLAGRWAEVAIRPISSERYLVVIRDVDAKIRSAEEVKRLRLRVLTVQEDERRAISQNLHDELGQEMTALALRVGSLVQVADGSAMAKSLHETRRHIELITKRMRQLFYRIRPPGLNDESLTVALTDYCTSVAHSSGLSIVFDSHADVPNLDGAQATALYRLLQESLTNVIKHAAALTVWVTLSVEAETASLAVEDDGVGFDPRTAKVTGIGLAGMRERFEMLDGELVIDSGVGSGTRVTGTVPLPMTGTAQR